MLHLKQAFRSLQKNKLFSVFNIFGFAIGFTVCIIIALYVYRENSVNSFFPDAERTYRLKDAGENNALFDVAILPVLEDRFPEIEKIASMVYLADEDFNITIKVGDKFMTAHEVISTNNDFFDLAGINILVSSTDKPFAEKNSVILARSAAMKVFGNYDVLGEPVRFFEMDFTVSAIAEDIPSSATFGANIYLNDEHTEMSLVQNCNNNDCYQIREIYFSAREGMDIEALTQKMNDHFPENRTEIESVTLQPVKSIYFSEPDEFIAHKAGNSKMVWIFITIAALTLFMSLFNYVNYTISKQLQTLKQMGIRMAAGAGKAQIFRYYLVEVGLSVIIALLLAVIFTSMALPLAEQLFRVELDILWLLKPSMLAIAVVVLMSVVLLAAWFPVSLIWQSNITSLLGKSPKLFKASSLSKIMTVAQLVISIVLLSSLLLINKQLDFVKTANYGFKTEQLLRINLPDDYSNYSVVKEAFSKLPFITDLSLTSHSPGAGWSRSGAKDKDGMEVLINTMYVDTDFVNTFQIKLLQGRNGMEGDKNWILVTETTLKQLGWDDFEGRELFGRKVIGVVNEFQYNSMHSLIGPVAFIYRDGFYSALNVRLLPENFNEQLSQMEKAWKQAGIEQPLQFQFYNEYYNTLYKKEDLAAKALSLFCIVAFIITCLGLLAQIIQVTEQRVKEIGIRKINGASIGEVMRMLNKKFVIAVLLSFIIATPVAYYAVSRWLQGFAYKTELSWWVFALSGLIALAITFLTVSWQSWRAASRNPVEALRYE